MSETKNSLGAFIASQEKRIKNLEARINVLEDIQHNNALGHYTLSQDDINALVDVLENRTLQAIRDQIRSQFGRG